MILTITPVDQLDWESPGRRLYHVPFTMDGAWGRVRVPLCVICGPRPGKTIVAIGGTHGDEYEGPVGLKNLIGTLDPADVVEGRLIVIPVLNVPAFQAAQRHSAQDGKNMNRVFPGDANGTITERIAHFVTNEVLARADVVIDIHAAGSTFEIVRSSSFHQIADPATVRGIPRDRAALRHALRDGLHERHGHRPAHRGSGEDGQDHHRRRVRFRRLHGPRWRALGASRHAQCHAPQRPADEPD